jgi:hypothetical protein
MEYSNPVVGKMAQMGGSHGGDDTGRRGAVGELRGFVEGSTNRAAMERVGLAMPHCLGSRMGGRWKRSGSQLAGEFLALTPWKSGKQIADLLPN